MKDKSIWQLASILGASCLFFGGCSHSGALKPAAREASAAKGPTVHLVFLSSLQCKTKPFGCGLGGQLGGIKMQQKLFSDLSPTGDVFAFWGGTTFLCDEGRDPASAAAIAEAAKALPLSFLAPSSEDLKYPLPVLRKLQATTGKPWVLSNYTAKNQVGVPWTAWLDVNVGQARFRVFNLSWPTPTPGRIEVRGFSPDIHLLENLLNASPADRINVVIVSSPSRKWLQSISGLRKAHVVLDAMAAMREPNGALFLPGDRVLGSVRKRGQAALVINMQTEPTFKGFFNESIAIREKAERQFAIGPRPDRYSIEKTAGLWETAGQLELLANPMEEETSQPPTPSQGDQ